MNVLLYLMHGKEYILNILYIQLHESCLVYLLQAKQIPPYDTILCIYSTVYCIQQLAPPHSYSSIQQEAPSHLVSSHVKPFFLFLEPLKILSKIFIILKGHSHEICADRWKMREFYFFSPTSFFKNLILRKFSKHLKKEPHVNGPRSFLFSSP